MSSFICQECNKPIVDTPQGYVTECEHWPLPLPAWRREDAPRATEARIDRGDAVNLAMDWLENRPTLTPKGIQALCNAVMLMDKTLSSRPAIIEECAREGWVMVPVDTFDRIARDCEHGSRIWKECDAVLRDYRIARAKVREAGK